MKPAAASKGKKGAPPALLALRRAAKKAIELARTTGTSAYVLKDGHIVDAAPARKSHGRA
jgi:hypothetical protein